ncbi:MAG TPA: M50 family metallopeptidase [Candidatus Dormibacteraeota bacterium]|nr:M50 family metallopeptidase [Candidatus Dormibacteraeota bacterium]
MGASLLPIVGLLAFQVVVLLLGTAVHELGHALASRAVGFRVAGVRVGPLLAVPVESGGWRVRLTWEMAVGGELLPDPVRPDRLRARHAAMIAGGPVAHLVLAGMAVAVAQAVGGVLLWFTAATLAAGALANLVPGRPRLSGRWTDGRWLLAWLTEPERAAQRVGLGVLQRAVAAGQRPSEWDEQWARLAAAGARHLADRAQVAGCLLAYARAVDCGQVDRAAALLTRAFAARRLLPAGARRSLAAETAFFVARFRGSHALAARLLEADVADRPGVAVADVERARAAVHLASGRFPEALAACDLALAALDRARSRPTGLVRFDRDLVAAMRDQARSGPTDQGGPAGQILWSGGLLPIGQAGTPSRSAGPEPEAGDDVDSGCTG